MGIPYGERKKLVIDGINRLGPPSAQETKAASDTEAEARVRAWGERTQGDLRDGVLLDVLVGLESACSESEMLIQYVQQGGTFGGNPKGQWLNSLLRRLGGPLGSGVTPD